MVSVIIKRDSSGKRTISYVSEGKTLTTKELSGDEFKERYGTGRTASKVAAIDQADIISDKLQSTQAPSQTFYDETGRELTQIERIGLESTAGGQTTIEGTTRYVKYDTIRTGGSNTADQFRYASQDTPVELSPEEQRRKRSDISQRAAVVKEKEIRRYNQLSPVGRFIYDSGAAAKVRKASIDVQNDPTFQAIPVGLTVAGIGSFPSILGASKTFIAGVNYPISSTVARAAGGISQAGLRNTLLLGLSATETALVTKGAYTVGQLTSKNPITRSGQGFEAYQAGVSEASKDLSFIDRAASNIPIVNRLIPLDRQAFERGVTTYASEKGLERSEAIAAAYQTRNIRDVSFSIGLSRANTYSEIGGQVAVSKIQTPATSFLGRFRQGFANIAPQGFIEGASTVIAEQAASNKNIKDFNYGAIAAGAGLGFFTAGTIGGVIYASPQKVGQTLLTAAYVTDPYEAVGDIAAGSYTTSVTGKGAAIALVNNKGSSSVLPTTDSLTTSATPSTATATLTNTRTFTPTTTQVNTPVNSPTRTNILLNSNIFTPVSTNTPTNTLVNVNINTNVNTNTPTTPITYTPTFTGGGLGLPLFPLSLGGGKGRKGFSFDRFSQQRAYQPSLSALVLNIRGSKPSRANIITGLGVRPIL